MAHFWDSLLDPPVLKDPFSCPPGQLDMVSDSTGTADHESKIHRRKEMGRWHRGPISGFGCTVACFGLLFSPWKVLKKWSPKVLVSSKRGVGFATVEVEPILHVFNLHLKFYTSNPKFSQLFPVFIVFYCTCSHCIVWSVADCIFSLTSAGLGSDMCSILKVCTHIQLTLFQQTLEKEFHLPLHCCGALTADIWITHLLNLKSSALEGKLASPPCPRQKDGFLRTLSLVTHPLLKNTT